MRRGISPVIAVLLLIVIAVAAAVLTYIWVVGYMGTLQQQSGAQQLQEKIKVEGVGIGAGGALNTVYVRNIGDVTVDITDVYLIDPSGNAQRYDVSTTGANVAPGSLVALDVSGAGWTLAEGVTYTIKVVTASGTEATYTVTYTP